MALEGFVLDGLNLSDGTALVIEEADLTPPAKRVEWAEGADSDGAALVRDPTVANRTITLKVRVLPKATMLLAAQAIAGISRKLEECEATDGGLPLVWTPADGTVAAVTFDVLSGSVTDLPMSVVGDSGYFVKAPLVSIELTCKPFARGAEVVGSAVSGTAPVLTVTVANVPGDVPAEGRLIVTDGASTDRRTAEWGLEQRFYDSATSLIIDSDDMITSGYGGAQANRTLGAYDPNATGNNVVRAIVGRVNTALCGIAAQSHVGTFRVRARIYNNGTTGPSVRLAWQDGDGPLNANSYAPALSQDGYNEVDLGVITISKARRGTQKWAGRIEGVSTNGGETVDIDYLVLIPCAEGYGRARGPITVQPGVLTGYDNFDSQPTTNGTALNGRVATGGGTWATSGATTDFVYDLSAGRYKRSTTNDASPRFGLLGTGSYAGVDVSLTIGGTTSGRFLSGIVARWVDSSNYLALIVSGLDAAYPGYVQFSLWRVVAGSVSQSTSQTILTTGDSSLRLTVDAAGVATATLGTTTVSQTWSALASGGALATGRAGIIDQALTGIGTASPRTFDAVTVTQIPTPPPAIYSGRTIEFASDGSALRQDSTGTYYGQAPAYRGSRFLVPPAGDKNRTSRVVVSAHRNDLDVGLFFPLGDNLTVQVAYTPRWLVVRDS